jgi:hypothetical protein
MVSRSSAAGPSGWASGGVRSISLRFDPTTRHLKRASPGSPGDEVLFRDLRTLHMPRRRITHTDWEADRARETAIPAMVITTAAVAGTAAVNFLSAIRR